MLLGHHLNDTDTNRKGSHTMLYDMELRYLEYQQKLEQSRKNYLLNDLPRRARQMTGWQRIRALLFL